MKTQLLAILMLLSLASFGQGLVKGRVTDENDQGLPGVNILIKGTTQGTVTDADGAFSLDYASSDAVFIVSFIGYASQEVSVAGQSSISIKLLPDVNNLEEVVVIGYGEQKKSVVTGAITSVKAEDLRNQPLTRIEQALQGRTSGVTIAMGSGQPGSSATVRVRGVTSINGADASNPLWVVDGVVVDNGGMGYLNQADIESIEVLKDAASQAIYGARAAAGVILITTKKGKSGALQVNYNGFFGTSAPARKLDLLTGTEYASMINESMVAAGKDPVYDNPAQYGKGTDWQKAIFNTAAKRQSHELSLSGGNDRSTFYTSFGYVDQEGIVASKLSEYNRVNVRLNSTHKITKWLTFGENVGYARTKSKGIATNSEFGGPLSSAINLDPLTPVVETDPTLAAGSPYSGNPVVRDALGRPYGISNGVGQELTNPIAFIHTRNGNYNYANDFVGNAYLEAEVMKGLKIRSTLGFKMANWGNESFTPIYYLNSSQKTTQTSYARGMNSAFNWNQETTISYSKSIGLHNLNVLVGQGSYLDGNSRNLNVTYFNIPVDNFEDATMKYNVAAVDRVGTGDEGVHHTVSSLFARLNYNFDERYLLTAIIRRDGSSRFGSNKKYGYFPSFSAGWVASKERFWPVNDVVNFLKVRGGYGVVGNDNIKDFAYLSTIGGGRNYTLGNSPTAAIGYSPNAPSNPDLKWESTSQVNIGFEATVINNVSVTFDWYKKETSDMLRELRIPGYVGAIGRPAVNLATMENSGYELELGYRTHIGEIDVRVNGNASYVQNKVLFLEQGLEYLDGGQTVQSTAFPITRTAVGQPMDAFFGFETLGIFQTVDEVQQHRNAEGKVIQPDAKPGDFRWNDRNGNGAIDEGDRTFLGTPTPKWSFGLTLNLAYKGFDLTIFGQGAAGYKIYQGLRRLDVANANWQSDALGRWTGAGSTNSYPRIVDGDPNGNFSKPSTFYLEDGDYFRLKTVQLGYNLPKAITSKVGLSNARIYVMSENLLTFTKYTGYDPEIGGGVFSIDRGIYPQARSFMVGVNIGF
jgi:TonB-linked SusC/RagA family outer membrane protein